MRIFGGERVKALMFRLGMTEGVPIESGLISRRIENSQKTVEAQNFDARKHLLEYDDVMNKQRETIYGIRRSALEGKDQRDYVLSVAEELARELVETFCPRAQHPDQWNGTQFLAETNAQFGVDVKAVGADPAALAHDELADKTVEAVTNRYQEKETQFGADLMRWLERRIILDVVDSQWKDHLLSLDHLKEAIGLRGYGQKDPLVEFKKEAFTMFEDMMARIDNETVRYLFHIQVQKNEQPPQGGNPPDGPQPPVSMQPRPQPPAPQQMRPAGSSVSSSGLPAPAQRIGAAAAARSDAAPATPQHLPAFAKEMDRRQQRAQQELQYQTGQGQAEPPKPVKAGAKVGRNDLCPCGSGKKYKKCHGANA
jgi:preprotein translocase subunit SecA